MNKTELQELSCTEIIEQMQDKLPALFFVFSRGRTELLAQELGRKWDFLDETEKDAVEEMIREAETEYPGTFSGTGWRILKRLLYQGIAYHHAGILPPVKYLVEKLYANRLLWVVFCTETFAAGVNFPAASAIFDSTRKWDGHNFRVLQNREFYQMAGRAGRRGFDQIGHAVIRIDARFPEQTGFFDENHIEPVSGRLTISPNTVLSLLRYKSDAEIARFLNDNFRTYQIRKKDKQLAGQIADGQKQVTELVSTMCRDALTFRCPIERAKAHRRLKYSRRRGKKKERDLLKKQLASHSPRKCKNIENCRANTENLKEAQLRLAALRQEYKAVTEQTNATVREYHEVRAILEKLGYVQDREFFPRGLFALQLHVQEILVTELAYSGIIEEADPAEIVAVLAGVEFIPGKNTSTTNWVDLPALREASQIRWQLLQMGVSEKFCTWSEIPSSLAYAWYNGAGFNELLEMSTFQPGDLFSIFRREIDLLRQIERAAGDNRALAEKIRAMRGRMDREEVALCF